MKSFIFHFFFAIVIAALASTASAQNAGVYNNTGHGMQLNTRPDQGLGFFGATPVIQPSGAAQAAVTGTSIQQFVVTGHNGAGSVTLTGAPIGSAVVSVVNLTTPANVSTDFETTLSVAGQIQQTSTNLSAATLLVTIDTGSGKALLNAIQAALKAEGLIKGSN